MTKITKVAMLLFFALAAISGCVPGPESATQPTDRYTLPKEDDVDQLVRFVEGIMNFKPSTVREKSEYDRKANLAVRAACERILELERDKSSDAYQIAVLHLLMFDVAKLRNTDPRSQRETLRRCIDFLSIKPTLTTGDSAFARDVAGRLEDSPTQGAKLLAADAYDEFSRLFAGSGDPELELDAKRFEGASRRLQSVGAEFQLSGKTIRDEEFDISALRGKLVLVDFWATWCGPCVQELPNVKEQYEKYHDKGLEIVGVSLDRELDPLEEFLNTEDLSWTTIPAYLGTENPVLVHYGILSIPQTILLDREGKVIATGLRGEELTRRLAAFFAAEAKSD
jgi:thiol-disulfide isomerase/thioredoxin